MFLLLLWLFLLLLVLLLVWHFSFHLFYLWIDRSWELWFTDFLIGINVIWFFLLEMKWCRYGSSILPILFYVVEHRSSSSSWSTTPTNSIRCFARYCSIVRLFCMVNESFQIGCHLLRANDYFLLCFSTTHWLQAVTTTFSLQCCILFSLFFRLSSSSDLFVGCFCLLPTFCSRFNFRLLLAKFVFIINKENWDNCVIYCFWLLIH